MILQVQVCQRKNQELPDSRLQIDAKIHALIAGGFDAVFFFVEEDRGTEPRSASIHQSAEFIAQLLGRCWKEVPTVGEDSPWYNLL